MVINYLKNYRSELSILISNLNSDDAEIRDKAIDGLFTLRDPVSLVPLIQFYQKDRETATKGENPSSYFWNKLFVEIGDSSGIDLVVNELENSERSESENAFNILSSYIDTIQLIEKTIPLLENLALRSGDSSARTKAKVLIQLLSNKKRDLIEREKVQERIAEFEKVTPSKEHLTFTILNQSGLGNLLPDLIMMGNSLHYWKTGLFLMHSYLQTPANGDKFITAIKMLTDSKGINTNSKCFLFYLAGKIEKHRENDKAATQYFQECKAEAPLIYEHLMNQDSAYDLHELQNYLIKAKDGNE